jgi:hypothetical protein
MSRNGLLAEKKGVRSGRLEEEPFRVIQSCHAKVVTGGEGTPCAEMRQREKVPLPEMCSLNESGVEFKGRKKRGK